jgi:adenylylsulfate kinase-like enzyme
MRKKEKVARYCPCIIVLGGLLLSGKTTIGQAVEAVNNNRYLAVDKTRKKLYDF